MVEFDAKEGVILPSGAALDHSVLVAMPSDLRVGGGLVPALSRISKIAKQSFFALVICSVTSMVAGFSLAKMSHLLALYPGLIILIPGAIDMRGTIFGTFGARLGTSLHTGEISPPLARSEPLRQQVGGVAVQVFSVSVILALVVKGLGLAVGLDTLGVYDLVLISVLSSVFSGLILLGFTLLVIEKSFRRGWDPDNVSVPFITVAGDVITIPILFGTAIFVTSLGQPLTGAGTLVFLFISTAAAVYSIGSNHQVMARIVRQSMPVLMIATLFSTVAGLFMGIYEEMLVAFSTVLLLIPVFNAVGGNLGGILSSRLTSAYHLGMIKMNGGIEGETKINFGCTLVLSAFLFPTLGLLAFVVSRAFGMDALGFGDLLTICLLAGLFTTILAILVTYYFTCFFVRIGVDPDNVTIPTITSMMDVLGTASLILVTMAVVAV
ncbi:MAG: magnesium transporter [Methanothrix sp.]|jgi:mgtE-like transporter|nr:magnesium transporter [Methanothrix sp.]OPX79449.1 MAG: Divalent cation transporter [Methanosaeta sp. PtaB.Bin087]OPY55104.1 MAG: Divalent cation transporter [Methanosaeta sp. PtaU1.Bin055]HNR57942.1 magnesium transporter [Methanothrix sp.]HOI70333.1 magnesium transporter [Methanothrix sp.]